MATTTWVLDPSHSEVQFKVKHMMISTVSGEIGSFSATLETEEEDFTRAKIHFEGDLNTISTKNEHRDTHLKSPDFFDVANHPHIVFDADGLVNKNGEHYELKGNLTIRGNTRPITLDVSHSGAIKDPYGHQRAGFEVAGKISRKDFGLSWNQVTEAGGLVVSDEVKVFANVQFVKQ